MASTPVQRRTSTPPAPASPDVVDDAAAQPDALTIGRRVRHLRRTRGMTIDELARAIDRAPSQVSVIENGKREPKFSQLQQIATALGTTTSELLRTDAPSRRAALE